MAAVLPMIDVLTETDSAPGEMVTPKGSLPLAAVEVRASIAGLIAGISVRQAFVNTFDEPLEAMYVFPLPSRAAVHSFRLEVAGRVVEGVLEEKGAARRTYQRAVQAGHRAALAEEERPGVFTMRVGNLPPGERAVVHLEMSGPLPVHDGECTFRFPLVIAPRYGGTDFPHPPVKNAGAPATVDLSLTVDIEESALAPHSFRSSLHTVEEESGKRFRLVPGERMDRDFVLRWRVATDRITTSLLVQDGHFLLTLVPPQEEAKQKPRDLVFVLDRSGSMSGWKMVAARRALGRMIDTLTEDDRFTVYAFDDSLETPPGFDGAALVPASDRMRERAGEWLSKIDARGGTEMEQPLAQATAELSRQPAEGVERLLVLLTDGQVTDEARILRALGDRLVGIRTFTLGIDRAVNEAFLRRLSELGGGRFELVESEERLDAVMDGIHRAIGTPVLTGLKLEGATEDVTPARLPDLFAGAPVLIAGRGTGALTVRGMAGKEPLALRVEPRPAGRAPVGPVWARGRIRDLEDQMAQSRGGDLRAEIVRVSLAHKVLCGLTSFVAVDRAEKPNPGGEQLQVTQAVDSPSGWGKGDAYSANTVTDFDPMEAAACRTMSAPPPAPCVAPVDLACLSEAEDHDDSEDDDFDDDFDDNDDFDDDSDDSAFDQPRDRAPAPPPAPMRGGAPGGANQAWMARERMAKAAPRVAASEKKKEAQGGGFWAGMLSWLGFGSGKDDLLALKKRAQALLDALQKGGDLSAALAEMKRLVQGLMTLGDTGPNAEALARAVPEVDLAIADPARADAARALAVAALTEWLA